MTSQVIKRFQLEVPLEALFESTVAQMAKVIEQSRPRQMAPEESERLLKEIETMSEDDTHCLLVGESPKG